MANHAARLTSLWAVAAVLGLTPLAPAAPPAVVTMRVPNRGIQPQAVTDAQGVVHLISFKGDPGHGDLFYVKSADGGLTWSRPMQVNSVAGSGVAVGNIRGAQLALGRGGRVHVGWMGSKDAEPKAPDGRAPMLYARLNDAADAFEPQRNVVTEHSGLDGGGSVAADDSGNVYVAWHAGPMGGGEASRRVWVAASHDDGKTFSPEVAAYAEATGACGCCGMRVFADADGALHVLYRSARNALDRDMTLVTLPRAALLAAGRNDGDGQSAGGHSGDGLVVDRWRIGQCPMSSAAIAPSPQGTLLAWEHDGQVLFALQPGGKLRPNAATAVPGPASRRKHPAIAVNSGGQFIIAWTEGMGWQRGGGAGWQVYDAAGQPIRGVGAAGHVDGVPVWSLVAAFTRADGSFVVMY
jgi:hypothetical protein